MAWEKRGNNRYYYRKRWVNGRVKSEYVGAGLAAELSAEVDTLIRQEQDASRAAWQETVEKVRNAERTLTEAESLVRSLTAAVLVVNGCYSHKRQWRRRVTGRKAVNHD
jgi:hypothetical protein